MSKSTRSLFGLFVFLFSSCVFVHKNKITTEAKPLKIAVVPCEVLGIPHSADDLSGAQKQITERRISHSLQAEVYRHLIDRIYEHHDATISLQAFSETNTLLEMAGVKVHEVSQRSTAELADMLEVDAVLRVTIEPKQAFTEPMFFDVDDQGLPTNQEIFVNVAETFITAGLFDGASGVPLWSIGQDKPAEIGLKHENIARRLVEKLGKVLP